MMYLLYKTNYIYLYIESQVWVVHKRKNSFLNIVKFIEYKMYLCKNIAKQQMEEERNMTISYKKLWIMLAEREMSKAELRRQAGLSPATFTKLRRNQSVSMEVLLKIAETLDCNIGDMMDFVKTAE